MKINISALKAMFLQIKSGAAGICHDLGLGKSRNDVPLKEMDILDHIEKIVELAHKHGIDKCQAVGKEYVEFVAGKLGVSPMQAVLFSLLVERSASSNILLSEIAESVKSSKVRVIKYISECEGLEKKKLVRCSRTDECISYRVPREVRESLRKHNEYRPEKKENINIDKFFSLLEQLFEERSNDELTFESLSQELLDLIKQNMHLLFCRKILSYNLPEDDVILLACFCHLAGNNDDDNIGTHDFEFLYDDKSTVKSIKRSFSDGYHPLIEGKLVAYNNNNGFINSESWRLSDMAKAELLSELPLKGLQNFRKNLVSFDSIKPKQMFYNSREKKEIGTLMNLLSDDSYNRIQERLDKKGMRKGFACLFSGAPGTGKTETAYQIARETKRDIYMVDIAETKSCWYGESEKKIKAIFDNYRDAAAKSKTAPILLLNEADAVIGKRKEISNTNPSIDQTENTIQNIILQEMENLSGIMIATTNLTQNMDKAFERRFLYKINFDKPAMESRIGIWKTMLPDISDKEAAELSGKFELSGGQIENIARKAEVDSILSGSSPGIETLAQYCRDENINNPAFSRTIGFCPD